MLILVPRRSVTAAFCLALGLVLSCSDGPVSKRDGASAEAGPKDGGAHVDGGGDSGVPGKDAAPSKDGLSADTQAQVDGTVAPKTLSEAYPGDVGLSSDPAVLFFDDFEAGWGRWDSPKADTTYLHLETGALAHGGTRYLRSTVTKAHLDAKQYISSSTRATFPKRVEEVYWRFYARFDGIAPNPHHWVRLSAGDASYGSSGLANTVPAGNKGFWFDFDLNNDNEANFYVYWYKMRSGRCNDGSTTPGCPGDQGNTYHYGNVFRPKGQTPLPKDKWICIEMRAKANTLGSSDGALAFWIDGKLVEEYRKGHPVGSWLRDQFHVGGCSWSACPPPSPFEGFDFRSSADVRFKRIFLDAYNERGTFAAKKQALENKGLTVKNTQTIYYDDVVVASKRIGCKVAP